MSISQREETVPEVPWQHLAFFSHSLSDSLQLASYLHEQIFLLCLSQALHGLHSTNYSTPYSSILQLFGLQNYFPLIPSLSPLTALAVAATAATTIAIAAVVDVVRTRSSMAETRLTRAAIQVATSIVAWETTCIRTIVLSPDLAFTFVERSNLVITEGQEVTREEGGLTAGLAIYNTI